MQSFPNLIILSVLVLTSWPGFALQFDATNAQQLENSTPSDAVAMETLSMSQLAKTYNVEWAAPKSEASAQCPEGSSPSQMHVHSQFREDIALNQFFFWGKTKGTFLEIGAYNGVWMSNTWMLETYFGWRGLLVEANPYNYDELPYNRPHATVVHAAGANGEPHNVTLSGNRGGGSSKIKKNARKGRNVTAFALKTLTEAVGLGQVDLLSVDVEGSELDVLKGFADELKNLQLLIVDHNAGYPAVERLLKRSGMKCVSDTLPVELRGPSEWWTGRDFKPIQAPEECRDFILKQVAKREWSEDIEEWLGKGGHHCSQFHRVSYNETDLGHGFWVAPPLKEACST